MKQVSMIWFNWRVKKNGTETYNVYEVGCDGVVDIQPFYLDNGGRYMAAVFEDGSVREVYNLNQVFYGIGQNYTGHISART